MDIYSQRFLVRDRVWRLQAVKVLDGDKQLLSLLDPYGGETLEVLAPPEKYETLPDEKPIFSKQAVSPWLPWIQAHEAIKYGAFSANNDFAALYGGRISPEPYQFAAVEKILQLPRPCILIADDVGLGKTIEAGICMLELIARGRGKRILLIVPPGLIPQWQDEMLEKFGLRFEALENAASIEAAKTNLSEGIKPWAFLNRVITSVEYVKKRDVVGNALDPKWPWDLIVVDEAHYLAESGTPKNPYMTARAKLGRELRDACDALILLTATPHNGYSHSFRSLLEIVQPTDATFEGEKEIIHRRVSRSMIRRLKPQIYKTDANGKHIPAFMPREPVRQIEVTNLTPEEKEIFKKVSAYCSKTAKDAEGTDRSELVSFAMQIIKKRMLSSRRALAQTVANRLDALKSKNQVEEPPPRSETRELQQDLPMSDAAKDRVATRIVKSAIPKEAKRRNAEKRQLKKIEAILKTVQGIPDPKMAALIEDLESQVLSVAEEKAIIFTEYRDTLKAIRAVFEAREDLKNAFVELTGGLSSRQRQSRMAEFEKPHIRIMLATDAASEGLNLQHHCRRLYHFELPWNPIRMEQRNGRIDRHGQTRNPIISYLFYPDSPEDNIMSRLVTRIIQMQDDKVSTPDILGFVSSAKIEEVLTGINAEENPEDKGESLFRIVDARKEQFEREVAPLLTTTEVTYGNKLDPQSLSADPLMMDDLDFEAFILERLKQYITPLSIDDTYALNTPLEFRGPGVADKYSCFTLKRSVAVKFPSRDVEFITRLHPLARAICDEAFRRLTAVQSPVIPARRIAVRRHGFAELTPYAVFTFSVNDPSIQQTLLSVAVDSDGKELDHEYAVMPLNTAQPPGEVDWKTTERLFGSTFQNLQGIAEKAAAAKMDALHKNLKEERTKMAKVLREDSERYRTDRDAEIDREEKEAKLAEERDGQLLLDVRSTSGFKARRAAIDTFHKKRTAEIDAFENVSEPSPPQPLGVLLVFPEEGGDGA